MRGKIQIIKIIDTLEDGDNIKLWIKYNCEIYIVTYLKTTNDFWYYTTKHMIINGKLRYVKDENLWGLETAQKIIDKYGGKYVPRKIQNKAKDCIAQKLI